MFKLALASLRFRLAASLATFTAVLIGCAILVVCGGIFETSFRLNAPPSRLANASVVVTGSTGYRLGNTPEVIPYSERSRVSAGLTQKLQVVTGVSQAVPDVSFPVMVPNHPAVPTRLYGHGWQSAVLTPFTLQGRAPHAGEVVVSEQVSKAANIQAGDKVALTVSGQDKQWYVSGIAAANHNVPVPPIFFNDAEAQQFIPQKDMVDAIGILAKPGFSDSQLANNIRSAVPADTSVLTGDDRGMAEYSGVVNSRLPLLLLGGVFSGMVLVVMVLVVSATIGLSVRQRQQELALLRANGATPRQVRRMVVIETMVVALLAIAAGAWLGDFASNWFYGLLAGHGLVAAEIEFAHSLLPLGAGVLLAMIITWITARIAAGAAAQTRPIQAMVEAAMSSAHVTPVRRWLAVIFAIGTVGLAGATMFMSPDTAAAVGGPAVLTGAIAAALFAPDLLYMTVRRLQRPFGRMTGGLGILASKNVYSRAAQFAGVLTPLTLAVAIALGNIYSQTTVQHRALSTYLQQANADIVVQAENGGITPKTVEEIKATPGVKYASPFVVSQGWIERPHDASHTSDPWRLVGVAAQEDGSTILAAPVTDGSLQNLRGQSVALPVTQAHTLKLAIGDSIGMRLGDGAQVTVKVVALLDMPADYANIVLPADLLAKHTSSGLASYVLALADRRDANRAAQTVRRTVEDHPGLVVGKKQLLSSSIGASLDVQAWINYLIAGLAIAYAAIATVNALTTVMVSRRKEYAMQRLLGATRQQILRIALLEALLVAVTAIMYGTIISAFTILPMAVAVGAWLPTGPVWVFVGVVLATLLIALPVAFGAARAATKRRPIENLSIDT